MSSAKTAVVEKHQVSGWRVYRGENKSSALATTSKARSIELLAVGDNELDALEFQIGRIIYDATEQRQPSEVV
jgi:hypothetical protein